MNLAGVLLICNLLYCFGSSISSVELIINGSSTLMYSNNTYTKQFISYHTEFSCSLNNLFTYEQTLQNLQNNTPYQISIKGISAFTSISISTQYGLISPNISSKSCSTDCILQIYNSCPNPVGFFNYFDTIVLKISNLQTFTYNVLCDKDFGTESFQAGQFIIIVSAVIIIVLSAIYSRAWAFQSKGIQITYLYIFIYCSSLAVGGTTLILAPNVAQIIGDIIIWMIGISSIAVCVDQLLFKLKIQMLTKALINVKSYGIRVMDVISFFVGVALLLSWILSDKNWILNDIISVSVIVATIKIFKVTSLKKALVLYLASITIQIVFVILIDVLERTSYQHYLLNQFNNPLQIQLPTINPVFGLKCSWLPVSVTIFPGFLISYFKRFDHSRNTKIYLITSSVCFFGGSIMWMIVSVFSPFSLPFQLISYPLMLGLVIVFAYNRKQIKILWNGKFYDPEFKNQEEEEEENYTYEMENKKIDFKECFLDGLKIDNNEDSEIDQSQRGQVQKRQPHKDKMNEVQRQDLNGHPNGHDQDSNLKQGSGPKGSI